MTAGRTALVADLFCGAGSLSTGANDALVELGYRPKFVAVNHWDIATQTYARNHPGASVHCVTLDAAFPMALVPEGRLDLLMAGIECTYFSRARGGKPVNDQQRMSAWHVVRWCTELRVKRLLLENVPEFVEWGPVDPRTGRPIKKRKGEYFRAWIAALKAIGFNLEMRVLNCANFGDATTRERLFILGWQSKKALPWPTPSHARRADLFGALKWRAARDVIDWSIRGKSIFDRKRPLAPKTLARIAAGIVKFRWPEPFIVVLRQHCAARGIDLPLPAILARGTHLALAEPIIVNMKGQSTASPSADPLPTQTAHARHMAVVEAFTVGNRENNVGKSLDEPIPTATTAHGGGIAVVEPFVFPAHQGLERNRGHRPVSDPMSTITASGTDLVLVEPFVATVAHGNDAHEREPNGRRCRSIDEPLQTIHAGGGKFAVVEPFMLSQASGGSPRATSEPVPTIPGDGAHALIAPYYGSGSGETCRSADDPLPTATQKARFGLVMPVTHSDGSNRARSLDDPIPTLTTAKRGEFAFIAASFGEREGQEPRVHSVDEPAPTICAQGRVNLVVGAETPAREFDILFRMLEPHELAAAMSISEVGRPYHFVGNKTEVIRQIGQAVPRRTGRALALALMGATP